MSDRFSFTEIAGRYLKLALKTTVSPFSISSRLCPQIKKNKRWEKWGSFHNHSRVPGFKPELGLKSMHALAFSTSVHLGFFWFLAVFWGKKMPVGGLLKIGCPLMCVCVMVL